MNSIHRLAQGVAQSVADARVTARWEHVLTIGNDESGTTDDLLGMPWLVTAASDGYIYVADRSIHGIKVFDRSGAFVAQFGSRGQGPGEFRDVTGMALDARGNLVVADGQNRRITRFHPDGHVLHDQNMDRIGMTWPRRMAGMSSGEMLFLYKLPGLVESRGLVRPDSAAKFHVYNADFTDKLSAFGNWERILDGSGLKEAVATFAPGNFDIDLSGKRLVYAPAIYEGWLFFYSLSDSGWVDGSVARGKTIDKPFTEHDPEYSRGTPGVGVYLGAVDYAAELHSISLGVFYLTDGSIVHFVGTNTERIQELGVELYSSDGDYVGYDTLIPDLDVGTEVRPTVRVAWKDDNDVFYLIDYREYPIVQAMRLHVSIQE